MTDDAEEIDDKAEDVQLIAPNGEQITGTLEVIPGIAQITAVYRWPDGSVHYDWQGETKVLWDDQQTVIVKKRTVFVGYDGETWLSEQLVPVGTEPDENAKPVEAYSTFHGVYAWGWETGVTDAVGAIMKALEYPHCSPDDIAVAIEELKAKHQQQS